MPNPLITLTTDFGTSDHFVGTMKGVILGIAPKVTIVDITHEIRPYDVNAAAHEIAQSWKYFPKGSIHVAIVDPGVGSDRRPILVEAERHFFIGPDNGLFSRIYDATRHKVRIISNPRVMLKQISRTFHGRDIFAPAAAHLASGKTPSQFGELIRDYVRPLTLGPSQIGEHAWRGTILKVDRFGNLITNFSADTFASMKTRPFEVRLGRTRIRRLALNYAETQPGELFVIEGSSGYLEIGANQASACSQTGCGAGAPVELEIFY
jgi:S-adenosylmethionine hydrolase